MKRSMILLASLLAAPLAAQAHEATPQGYSSGQYDRRDCDDGRYRRHWYRQETHDWRDRSTPWTGWHVPFYRPYAWAPPAYAWNRGRDWQQDDHRWSHDRDSDRDHD